MVTATTGLVTGFRNPFEPTLEPMMTTTIAVALVLLALFPVVLIWNLTESKTTKIRRARSNRQTGRVIADRYGISQSTARRWAKA